MNNPMQAIWQWPFVAVHGELGLGWPDRRGERHEMKTICFASALMSPEGTLSFTSPPEELSNRRSGVLTTFCWKLVHDGRVFGWQDSKSGCLRVIASSQVDFNPQKRVVNSLLQCLNVAFPAREHMPKQCVESSSRFWEPLLGDWQRGKKNC